MDFVDNIADSSVIDVSSQGSVKLVTFISMPNQDFTASSRFLLQLLRGPQGGCNPQVENRCSIADKIDGIILFTPHFLYFKPSLYSRYYAEVCNE